MKFIFGASGHAKEIEWLIQDIYKANLADYRANYFVCEDSHYLKEGKISGIPIINESKFFDLTQDVSQLHECFVAVGDSFIREKIVKKIFSNRSNIIFPNLIHPSVNIDKRLNSNSFGMGNVICAGSSLTTNIILADFIHININCTVSHDVRIHSYCTLSPGVHICGNVTLKENVFLGAGAIVIECISIQKDIKVGAGSVVVKSLIEPDVYIGVPANKITKIKKI